MYSETEIEKDSLMFERVCQNVSEVAIPAFLADNSKKLDVYCIEIAERFRNEAAMNEQFEMAAQYSLYISDVKRNMI